MWANLNPFVVKTGNPSPILALIKAGPPGLFLKK
jgi:hypothetical protein